MTVLCRMTTVSSQGTVRNIIRGIENTSFISVLYEPIDDAEHSNSKKVFLNFNVRDRSVIIGYEKSATMEQMNGMGRIHGVNNIHDTNGLATCGVGLQYYKCYLKGKHRQSSIIDKEEIDEEGNSIIKPYYISSSSDVSKICESARNTSISEIDFDNIINREATETPKEDKETLPRLMNIFNNNDSIYPFNARTIFMAEDIKHQGFIDQIKDEDEIQKLKIRLSIKYFDEIKRGDMELFVRWPLSNVYEKILAIDGKDVIGSTCMTNQYNLEILQCIEGYNVLRDGKIIFEIKVGEILFRRNNQYLICKKNGNSYTRSVIDNINIIETNLKHIFNYTQYNINKEDEILLKSCIVGTSLEKYAGIYLKIGNKFTNDEPIPYPGPARNLIGAKLWRGILEIPESSSRYVKSKISLQGLKANTDILKFSGLKEAIMQASAIYEKYTKSSANDKDTNFSSYAEVKTTNEKTKNKSKPGICYLLRVGPNFYKFGKSSDRGKADRIFSYFSQDDYNKLKTDFPEEDLYDMRNVYYVYLPSYTINNYESLEKLSLDFILSSDNICTYDNKNSGSFREYFHCEDVNEIEKLIKYVRENEER